MALLIAISIYVIKHRSKQKKLLPYHNTSKLKENDITKILIKYKVTMNQKKLILKIVCVIILMT